MDKDGLNISFFKFPTHCGPVPFTYFRNEETASQ